MQPELRASGNVSEITVERIGFVNKAICLAKVGAMHILVSHGTAQNGHWDRAGSAIFLEYRQDVQSVHPGQVEVEYQQVGYSRIRTGANAGQDRLAGFICFDNRLGHRVLQGFNCKAGIGWTIVDYDYQRTWMGQFFRWAGRISAQTLQRLSVPVEHFSHQNSADKESSDQAD
jgi:hypothetical protein